MSNLQNDERREDSTLVEIRRLMDNGELDDAMSQIETYLTDHADDVDAKLLKVEICFAAHRDFPYIVDTLKAFDALGLQRDRVDLLQTRRQALVEEYVTNGRGRLMRVINDGIPFFESALVLEPEDPSVPFAAALALFAWKDEKRDEVQPGLFGSFFPVQEGKRRIYLQTWAKQTEKYLRLARERSQPGQGVYQKATERLIQFWLSQSEVHPDLLAILSDPSQSTSEINELTRQALVKVIEHASNIAVRLLRNEDDAQAEILLTVCTPYAASVATFHYVNGEYHRVGERADDARAAYMAALNVKPLRIKSKTALTTASRILKAISEVKTTCKYCGRASSMPEMQCSLCASALNVRQLTEDRFNIEPNHIGVLARIGLAELLRQHESSAAENYMREAIALLEKDHRAIPALTELLTNVETTTPKEQHPAEMIAVAVREEGLTPAVMYRITRLTNKQPGQWLDLALATRVMIARRLIDTGALKPAQAMMNVAFNDHAERANVKALHGMLKNAIMALIERAKASAQDALASGDAESAIQALASALELNPLDELVLLRAQARMSAGHDAPALDDFYGIVAASSDVVRILEARKGIAALLEKRFDLSGARKVLEDANAPTDVDVRDAMERIMRRERGEPLILIERDDQRVIEDTLERRQIEPYTHGLFAVVVREVARPNMPFDVWAHRLLVASFEFVQVLGAYRELLYDVTFALRVIALPHPHIAERGQIKIALLARVGGEDSESCTTRAMELWRDLRAALPLVQDGVYSFEAVADHAELGSLLMPFDIEHAAEIVRRETSPDVDGVYTTAPFMPGSMDLHNLFWSLLRQEKPSLVSIHLKPTQLYSWERSAALYANDNGKNGAGASASSWDQPQPVTPEGMSTPALMSQLGKISQMERTRGHFYRVSGLQSAFIARVTVAGHGGTSRLLPEMVAAAMLGPSRDNGENGGYEIMRALRGGEFDTAMRNLRMIDVERWGYTTAPERMRRLRYLVGEAEASSLFRLPIPHSIGIPGMRSLDGKPIAPPVGMPENGTVLGVSTARTGSSIPALIRQSRDDRRRHSYVVGKTGMGKSTLIASMALQDIEAGYGVFLLDPHGDLVEDVLMRIPAHRADDVILIDPSDEERAIGLNILTPQNEADRHRIANDFIGMLIRMYDPYNQGIVGPIFQQWVRNAMLAAMCLESGTLIDVYRILSDSNYVRRILPKITDPIVKNFWEEIASRTENASAQYRAELLPYLLSKFSRFVDDSVLRRMLGQPRSSIPWRDVMDDNKIVLVNLAKGRIGTETSQFLGLLILGDLLQAAFQRSKLPPNRRSDFYIYIDEVQNYSTPLLGTMISEGRKFGVSLVIANQFLHQLDHGIREAVFGNVGSLVAFRVGVQDAPALAPEYHPVFTAEDLIELGQFTACVKLLVNGVGARAFTMRTLLPSQTPNILLGEQIREHSRQRYSTDIHQVDREIKMQF